MISSGLKLCPKPKLAALPFIITTMEKYTPDISVKWKFGVFKYSGLFFMSVLVFCAGLTVRTNNASQQGKARAL